MKTVTTRDRGIGLAILPGVSDSHDIIYGELHTRVTTMVNEIHLIFDRVPYLRFARRLLSGRPSRCRVSLSFGRGPTNAANTRW